MPANDNLIITPLSHEMHFIVYDARMRMFKEELVACLDRFGRLKPIGWMK